ncbi:hypothetical protein Droror1_Dr00003320 [Drosera rotundifolia]
MQQPSAIIFLTKTATSTSHTLPPPSSATDPATPADHEPESGQPQPPPNTKSASVHRNLSIIIQIPKVSPFLIENDVYNGSLMPGADEAQEPGVVTRSSTISSVGIGMVLVTSTRSVANDGGGGGGGGARLVEVAVLVRKMIAAAEKGEGRS